MDHVETSCGVRVPGQVGWVTLTAQSEAPYRRGVVDVAATSSDVGWRLESTEVNAASETFVIVRPGARAFVTVGASGTDASDLRIGAYHHADGALVWLLAVGGAAAGALLLIAAVRLRGSRRLSG